ncbi:hypothetical protein CkaCkLH20_03527 [Colletotrichum karsti]|uniref:F-box domain-containing protein n=1 Tax=Colletotrichum karsti TaxID=1095194 RepID=A0A9P6IB71_9PEZI|nr:uncharacterized protein CkaCkLH20_03527 [Colletotrichum karsti]KAF9879294.1 hypothetical protein CkaCkLH20_03527 [Colletotrichum karsti]
MPRRRKLPKESSLFVPGKLPKNAFARILPPELVLVVLSFLPTEAVFSFALTCRFFYASFFPNSRTLDLDSKTALLTLLERDIPNLLVCHGCTILLHWKQQDFNPDPDSTSIGHQCSHVVPATFFAPLGYINRLEYAKARLVMNRHLYGSSHGLPVEMLNWDGHGKLFLDGDHFKAATAAWRARITGDSRHVIFAKIDYTQTWRARIVDDELYLAIFQTAYHPSSQIENIETCLRHRFGRICRHVTIWNMRDPPPNWITITRDTAEPPHFAAYIHHNTILSCPICFTDAQVNTTWCSIRGQWSVQMTTWRQFGKCRSPSDPKWNSFVSGFRDSWVPRERGHPPGAIRHRWSRGDEVLLGMEGVFLDAPLSGYQGS